MKAIVKFFGRSDAEEAIVKSNYDLILFLVEFKFNYNAYALFLGNFIDDISDFINFSYDCVAPCLLILFIVLKCRLRWMTALRFGGYGGSNPLL